MHRLYLLASGKELKHYWSPLRVDCERPFRGGFLPESLLVRSVCSPRALYRPTMATIANVKKRRGVACASLTRLANRVKELERNRRDPKTSDLAERTAKKLSELDTDFHAQHHALVDLIEGDEALEREQETLDAHDDLVTELSVQIKQIISSSSPSVTDSARKTLSR